MATTQAFDQVTARLAGFLASGQSFSIDPAKIDFSETLSALIGLLAGEALSLVGATLTTSDGPPASWTVTGSPAAWPIPGLSALTGATLSLTVTDGEALSYGIGLSGPVGGATLSGELTLAPGDDASATLSLDAGDGLALSGLAALVSVPGLGAAIGAADDLLAASRAAFKRGSITIAAGEGGGASAIASGQLTGSLALAGVTANVTVDLPKGAAPTGVSVAWSGTSCAVGALLAALHLPFELPAALDAALSAFTIAYEPGETPSQTRLALTATASGAWPSLQAAWARGDDKAWRMVAQAGWSRLDLGGLPVVGASLPLAIDPFMLVVLSSEMGLQDLQALASLPDELKTFGYPADAPQDQAVPAGVYCLGVAHADLAGVVLVHAPARIPLYSLPAASTRLTATRAALAEANITVTIQVQKTLGPLHLSSLGFRYAAGVVAILLDMSVDAGGLELEPVGLALGYDVASHSLGVDIDGLLVSYSAGGVAIAGGLAHSPADSDWGGTALVSVGDAFALGAMAAFSTAEPRSMFVFGYDHQELGGPPWLIITGIAAGFGYNRQFVVPDVADVDSFPFVTLANSISRGGAPNGGAPLDINALWGLMDSIETYLRPGDGSDFLTVGLTATSFGLVNTTALLTIVVGPTTEIALLGSSSVSVPSDAPVAHAEVELVASVQPQAGLLAIDGLLAPGSYVLSEACHLTGGFAYHLWFSGEHRGDFVLTFGGYGPSYPKPAHYPDVPRLAFDWQVSDDLSISGWSYFALTPTWIQAGGGLSINLSAGPLSAWCHTQTDIFVDWAPFHYDLHASVDFGVSFSVDMLFCTVTLSADISVDLDIWGPDFTGHADVDLAFVSFGVDFGAGAPRSPPGVDWDQFMATLVTPGPPSGGPAPLRLGATASGGDYPPASTQQPVRIEQLAGVTDSSVSGVDWAGDGERTRLAVRTKLAASTASLNGSPVSPAPGALQPGDITARPLKNSPKINPDLEVTITSSTGGDLGPWTAELGVDHVAGGAYGDANTAGELVPGGTTVTLFVTMPTPDTLGPIDQQILLVDSEAKPIDIAWEAPTLPPEQSYSWATDGPFATLSAAKLRASLAAMASAGYVDPAALDAIDLTFMTANEPCFMDQPVLAELGAEQYAGAAQ